MDGANIVIVGAGKGGYEFLKVLTNTPNISIKYVCDINPNAKGMLLARATKIPCVTRLSDFIDDPGIDLIFESTGRREVFEEISRRKRPSVSLVGSAGTRVLFSLLDSYNEVNRNLQSYRLNLERRIIERTEELEKTNAALELEKGASEKLYERQREINEEKSRYLIHTTHQLKAPFAAIQNYVDIILDGYTGDITEQTRTIIQKIKKRCELLSETIKDMLELAKLQSQMVDLVREDVLLRDLTAELAERFGVAAAAKQIQIKVQVDETIVVRSIRAQLFDLLTVLMENAIKYSPPGSSVELVAERTAEDKVAVSVIDHGIGIAPEHTSKIFTEFFRANNAVRFEPNGNGLGLAIARELANYLEATIEVESKLNEGSTFRVRLGSAETLPARWQPAAGHEA
jgi:signal transduction histidine kinase